jgi:ADP-ribosyl-[dinitrogen reductase] hydrolase
MRCAPVALYRSINPELLVADSAVTCSITHYAPACQWSCIILNTILAKLLEGLEPSSAKILVPALAETAVYDGASQEVQDRMTQVGSEIDDLKLDEGRIGHTLLCLQAGLWALQTLLNFEEALVSVINAGGDTDTNGAVAGAVLGGRCGASAIPQRWLDCIPERQRVDMLSAELWNP